MDDCQSKGHSRAFARCGVCAEVEVVGETVIEKYTPEAQAKRSQKHHASHVARGKSSPSDQPTWVSVSGPNLSITPFQGSLRFGTTVSSEACSRMRKKEAREQDMSARLQAGLNTGTRCGGFETVSGAEDLIWSKVWAVK